MQNTGPLHVAISCCTWSFCCSKLFRVSGSRPERNGITNRYCHRAARIPACTRYGNAYVHRSFRRHNAHRRSARAPLVVVPFPPVDHSVPSVAVCQPVHHAVRKPAGAETVSSADGRIRQDDVLGNGTVAAPMVGLDADYYGSRSVDLRRMLRCSLRLVWFLFANPRAQAHNSEVEGYSTQLPSAGSDSGEVGNLEPCHYGWVTEKASRYEGPTSRKGVARASTLTRPASNGGIQWRAVV